MIGGQKNSPDAANIEANANPHSSPDVTKAISTLKAKLALAGHAVHQTVEGGFFVSKYGMSYFAEDIADLEGFARRLGVK